MNLLTTGNPKILKGHVHGYLSSILHLAPYNLSGHQVCIKATSGCAAACLNTAGRGGIIKAGETTNIIQQARIRKTKLLFSNRDYFMGLLAEDIIKTIRYAENHNLVPVFRLNGTSDIVWEKIPYNGFKNIMQAFPTVQFYDYTKILNRKVPANYHLTFSAADGNDKDVIKAIDQGYNVAVVFNTKKGQPLPEQYLGLPVFNGDDSDLRFLDPRGVIVGLYAKGKAKHDTTGFVKRG